MKHRRDPDEDGWWSGEMTSGAIGPWLNRLFPTSWGGARLFQVEGDNITTGGEAFDAMVVSHAFIRKASGLTRSVGVLFINGGEHCAERIDFYMSEAGEISRIHVVTKGARESHERGLSIDAYFADSEKTDPASFSMATGRLVDFLKLIASKKGRPLEKDDPLLNFGGNSGGPNERSRRR